MLQQKELSRRELIDTILQQHEFYTNCIDRLCKMLEDGDLPEYARAVKSLAVNYGLDIKKLVKEFHYREGFLTFGQLYDVVVELMTGKDFLKPWDIKALVPHPFSETDWVAVIRTLKAEGKIETQGSTNHVKYKLVA